MSAQATGEAGKGLVEPVLMADFVGLLNDALQRRAQVLHRSLGHCRIDTRAAVSALCTPSTMPRTTSPSAQG